MSGGPNILVSIWYQVLSEFRVQLELPWDLSGFGLWLQLVHCTYLLTLSKYFRWGQTSDFGNKSETSLCRGKCRRVVRLEVQPLELAFMVDS